MRQQARYQCRIKVARGPWHTLSAGHDVFALTENQYVGFTFLQIPDVSLRLALSMELVSLSPEHRNTQRDRDTKQIHHRSYQGDTRQYRFNVYSCKAHIIIDSRRACVAAFIGRQKERARQHAASKHGRQGQSRVYSSTILLSQPSYKIDRNCVWHQ